MDGKRMGYVTRPGSPPPPCGGIDSGESSVRLDAASEKRESQNPHMRPKD